MNTGDHFSIEGSYLIVTSGLEKGRRRKIESYDPSTCTYTLKRTWIERIQEAIAWLKRMVT